MQFQGTLVLEKYNKEGVHCFNLIALQFYGSLMFIYLSYIMCIHFHCKSPETDLLLNDFYAEVEKLMQVIIYESLQTVKSDTKSIKSMQDLEIFTLDTTTQYLIFSL